MLKALLGIFVGGRARRMGGVQKALLLAPDREETLLARLIRIGRAADLEVVLVGNAALGEVSAGLIQLRDAADGVGPIGGLASLLAYAGERDALCVACDMPFLGRALLSRLASEQPDALTLAPRDPSTGKWQAMFARHASARMLPRLHAALDAGQTSFQMLFEQAPARELALDGDEHAQLRDWDTPDDMR
ncbi:MAG TPA: molybdenum cofactor guanylyltransferase [Polyangiales bacterium]|nr:molybdenum cofactor guanylyltransferase [Polyangiales bacterium]